MRRLVTDTGRWKETPMDTVYGSMRQRGLVRPANDRVLGGVCAGLGRRFGLEPWTARLLFILVLLVLPGSQFLIYPILWIIMPSEEVPVPPIGLVPDKPTMTSV